MSQLSSWAGLIGILIIGSEYQWFNRNKKKGKKESIMALKFKGKMLNLHSIIEMFLGILRARKSFYSKLFNVWHLTNYIKNIIIRKNNDDRIIDGNGSSYVKFLHDLIICDLLPLIFLYYMSYLGPTF